MNRKQFIILLLVLAVLGGAGLLLRKQDKSEWQGSSRQEGNKLLGDLPVNDVAAIFIQSGTNQLTLERKDNVWKVKERSDYPANFNDISSFLLQAADLKAGQVEDVTAPELPRYKLLPPGPGTNTATLVELRDQNGKAIRTMLLGKTHMKKASPRSQPMMGEMGEEGFPDGRYVMLGAGSKKLALVADPLSRLEPKPEQWLNRDFLKVDKARSIAVTTPAVTNSWKITRDTEAGEWKLADAHAGEQLDNAKVSPLTNPMNSASINDVETQAKPEQLGLDKPVVLALDTFEGFNYTIKVGQKTNDNYPVTLTVAANLSKEREAAKDEKPEDKARLDKEFKDKQTKLEEKLAQEKKLENWTFLVSSWSLEPLMKDRAQLLMEKQEEAKPAETKPGEIPLAPAPAPVPEKQP